ncbi:small, acid-soluble spore protein N [Paraliobacillus ryukyuensis]|uniref:Small acid-soluble spore N family protein n=1 Tax=Paraliobacillus ryukyuensis TaxID=200904 RepID=A0A366EH21_9BACI|nr:small acid-soluble spore protein N [Paraliobacillus ryukyuensis]RBP01697.1 small acid-soluble spore N family protein [Paraliobacillus ryukyuensis]
MSNPKRDSEQFQPDVLGTQPRKARANNAKKMGLKKDHNPELVDQKGK